MKTKALFDGISVMDDVIITAQPGSSFPVRDANGKRGTVIERNDRGLVVSLHRGHVKLLTSRKEVVSV